MDAERQKRVQALYETAVQLDPGKRDEFLRRFCGDEPHTRDMVDALLRDHDRSGSDAPTVRQDAFIGTTVGAYDIEAKLGQGGMGLVYKARQKRLNRWVALKVLPFEKSGDPKRRRRFLQEARTASALSHPHIVTIHDVVTVDDVDYIVMEHVEGTTLSRHIPEGGLPVAQALRFGVQLAQALGAAHARGIIHRDLKPSNVMVANDGTLKILDFGLAKLRGVDHDLSESSVTASLTQEGAVIGTPNYMSPEQAEGLPVDARTDVFSLGVVLYEMLTGLRPFRGSSQLSVLHDICHTAPKPVEEVRPDVPGELADMVRRCLAKAPADRFGSADELAGALEDLAGRGETAGDASRERTASWVGPGPDVASRGSSPAAWRRWKGPALLAAGALALAAFLAFVAGRSPSAQPATESTASAAARTPFALYEEGRGHLARPDQKDRIEHAIAAFESAIEQDDAYAPAYAGLAAAHRYKYAWRSRDALFLNQAEAAARRAVELDPHLAIAHAELGLTLVEQGKPEDAEPELREALRLDPKSASAELGLAAASRASQRMDDAEGHYRRAIALRPDDWTLRSAFGEFLFLQAQYDEAQKEYQSVLDLTPDNAVGWESLAATLHMQGRSEEAATALQRALEIKPDANTYSNLGTLHYFEGRYAEAAEAFERAVELRPNQYVFWANLGDAYRWVPGADAKGQDAFARAVQLAGQSASSGDNEATERLPEYLAKAGDTVAALRALAELEVRPNNSPDTWFVFAKAYELCGEREKALEALSQALAGGYSVEEIKNEPDLIELRQDVRYHRMVLPWDQGKG